MVIVGVIELTVAHLQPNIEMNWNLLKFLPEVASCQTNFNVCLLLSNVPTLSFWLRWLYFFHIPTMHIVIFVFLTLLSDNILAEYSFLLLSK